MIIFGIFFFFIVVVYILEYISWVWGFGILFIVMVVVNIIFFLGMLFYRYRIFSGSLFMRFV